jgi:hypothetical protein
MDANQKQPQQMRLPRKPPPAVLALRSPQGEVGSLSALSFVEVSNPSSAAEPKTKARYSLREAIRSLREIPLHSAPTAHNPA